MKREVCPRCGSSHHKKNGHIHTGKQNYRCQACGRQFVAEPTAKTVTEATRALIKKALLERNSLRGICRIFDVSLTWLLALITELYDALPRLSKYPPYSSLTIPGFWLFLPKKARRFLRTV